MSDVVTRQAVRDAIDAVLGSMVASPEIVPAVRNRVSALEVEFASGWSGGPLIPAAVAFAAIDEIRSRLLPPAGFKTRADWQAANAKAQQVTPQTVAACVDGYLPKRWDALQLTPATGSDVASYLRGVSRDEPAPALGRLVEIIRAAAHSDEDSDRISLGVYHRELTGFATFSEDEPAPSVVDLRANTSMAELAANPPKHDYLIPGVLVARQPALILAHEKCGKTSLGGVDLAVSLTTGTPFLGHFPVAGKHRVLFLSGESGAATIVETYKRICQGRDVDATADFGFVLSEWLPQFHDSNSLNELARRTADAGAGVVIVDPAAICVSAGAASTVSIAYSELRAATAACQASGATLVTLHHATKDASIARRALRAAAGAGWAEWARQWLLIDRIGQFKPVRREHRLRMTVGGSAGHAGQYIVDWREGPAGATDDWETRVRPVDAPDDAKASAKLQANLDAIKAVLASKADVQTASEIRKATKANGLDTSAALAHLTDAGIVIAQPVVRSGKERMAYSLATETGAAA